MLYFTLVIMIYWLLVYKFFDQSVAPLGKRIGTDFIPFPKRAVKAWIIVATALFSTTSVINARESNWKLQESMGALSVVLGIFLGLIAKVERT